MAAQQPIGGLEALLDKLRMQKESGQQQAQQSQPPQQPQYGIPQHQNPISPGSQHSMSQYPPFNQRDQPPFQPGPHAFPFPGGQGFPPNHPPQGHPHHPYYGQPQQQPPPYAVHNYPHYPQPPQHQPAQVQQQQQQQPPQPLQQTSSTSAGAGAATGTNGQKASEGSISKNANLLDLLRFSAGANSSKGSGSRHEVPETATSRASQQSPKSAQPMNPSDLVAHLFSKATSPPPVPRASEEPAMERGNAFNRQPPISPPGDSAKSPVSPAVLVHQILGRPKPDYDGPSDSLDNSPSHHVPDVAEESNVKPIRATAPTKDLNIDNLHKLLLQNAEQLGSGNVERAEEASAATSEAASQGPPKVPPNTEIATPPSAAATAAVPKPVFTYVNPFEQLHATSPRNRTPKPKSPVPSTNLKPKDTTLTPAHPSSIPLPFSPDPEAMQKSAQAGNALEANLTMEPQQQPVGDSAAETEATLPVRHTPPIMQPYVEDVHDPFGAEQDPLGGEVDPFDGTAEEAAVDDVDAAAPATQDDDSTNVESAKVLSHPSATESAMCVEETHMETHISTTNVAVAAEDREVPTPSNVQVKVFKFPMMPYSLITICPDSDISAIPASRFSDIARMGRVADQLDRNLLSATSTVIVYAMGAKSKGGIRVIRQDDGKDGILMKESTDKIVNVTIGKYNRVYATANSGAVFWIDLSDTEFDDAVLRQKGYIYPPSEEQSQNDGKTKSRVHSSSNHSDVFAVGRGKYISIIHSSAAQRLAKPHHSANEVDAKAYGTNYAKYIDTGKASKDFCFSQDDTAILTIDKAGKLKVWDVEKLVKSSDSSQSSQMLTKPLAIYHGAEPGDSYNATSITLVDKVRPFQKKLALRYVLVGLRNNHVLQLWDLAIGRAVQEIRFPQESPTAAMCSIAFHAHTGVIVVGNPTRNSISFIHLSAPKYNIPNLSQTAYVRAIAEQSPLLPKLDSTAIMSAVREIRFPETSSMLSLDLLDVTLPVEEQAAETEETPLFELYVAHTKGMTCISVLKQDIGFDKDGKSKSAVDAVGTGFCTCNPLPKIEAPPETDSGEQASSAAADAAAAEARKAAAAAHTPAATQPFIARRKSPVANGPAAGSKPKVVQAKQDERAVQQQEEPSTREKKTTTSANNKGGKRGKKDSISQIYSGQAPQASGVDNAMPSPSKKPGKERDETGQRIAVPTDVLEREIKKFEKIVSTEFTKVLDKELTALYLRFDEDRRVQQVSADSKQEAVLRMMASSLTTGMEDVLDGLVLKNITNKVVPELSNLIQNSLNRSFPEIVNRQISLALPDAIKRAFVNHEVMRKMTVAIVDPLKKEIEKGVKDVVGPILANSAAESSRTIATEVNKRTHEVIQQAKRIHESDSAKIAQLSTAITDMTAAFTALEKSVNTMQEMYHLVLASKIGEVQMAEEPGAAQPPPPPPPPKTAEEIEMETIQQMIANHEYEDGVLMWMQSKERQDAIFDKVMTQYDPKDVIPHLSNIVKLTVAASVTSFFESFVPERLNWLGVSLTFLEQNDDEQARNMLPRIMSVIVSRLQQYYMSVAEENPSDPVLRKIPPLSRLATKIMHANE